MAGGRRERATGRGRGRVQALSGPGARRLRLVVPVLEGDGQREGAGDRVAELGVETGAKKQAGLVWAGRATKERG